mgnify:CR=1 FL=1
MNGLAIPSLNGISLFSGIAGLDLGIQHIIPNSRTICFVEREIYTAQILHQKMQLGLLHPAPIYSDVITFPSVAHHFSQKVDFITAGFPCQPFSQAGSRKGISDERWLWDSILDTISQTTPSFLFLENVSNLLNEWGAFDEISKTLSKIGFNIEWSNVRASDVGANHQRNRLFIFAYKTGTLSKLNLTNPNCFRHNRRSPETRLKTQNGSKIERRSSAAHTIPNPNRIGRNTNFKNLRCGQSDSLWKGIKFTHSNGFKSTLRGNCSITKEGSGKGKYDTSRSECLQWEKHIIETGFSSSITDSHNIGEPITPLRNEERRCFQQPKSNFQPSWWTGNPPFSPVCRVDDGIPHGMDRLRALGNAVVPLQAAHAFHHLILRGLQHDTP